jgi:holo-[acyl-carrier protein] synthase
MHFIGVDIVEIARIERAILRWGDSFLCRVYTDTEMDLYRNRIHSLAARFAAKEAVIKALGGFNGGAFREIEVLSDSSGKPLVKLYGEMSKHADRLGVVGLNVSLSHCHDYAVAFVLDSG